MKCNFKHRLLPLNRLFKFFNEWDGHGYYHGVQRVDSCILSSCSTWQEKKKHVSIVEDIVQDV